MSEKMTYLSCIIRAIEKLNGMGSLQEINNMILLENKLPAIKTNPNWKDNVRATIQRHCSQTKSYVGALDLFYSVYGLGEGYWGLRNYKTAFTDKTPIDERKIKEIQENPNIEATQKEMLINARVGQRIFRERVFAKYNQCIITGIKTPALLIASHIKPWRNSNNAERLSSDNGILLSPLYDKLFDRGLLTFDNKMRIVLSATLGQDKQKITCDLEKIYIQQPSIELMQNMEYHRDVIFKN